MRAPFNVAPRLWDPHGRGHPLRVRGVGGLGEWGTGDMGGEVWGALGSRQWLGRGSR